MIIVGVYCTHARVQRNVRRIGVKKFLTLKNSPHRIKVSRIVFPAIHASPLMPAPKRSNKHNGAVALVAGVAAVVFLRAFKPKCELQLNSCPFPDGTSTPPRPPNFHI